MTKPRPADEGQPTAAPPGASRARVMAGELSLDGLVAAVTHSGAGAIVTFVGTVRDTNEGRSVTKLEYEAYESMAAAEIARIVREIETEVAGSRVAVHHRTGELAVGDAAVICAASAPHRGQAFRACRLAIDRVKERVPIWKREHGPEGPYWIGWVDARCGDEHAEQGEHGKHGDHGEHGDHGDHGEHGAGLHQHGAGARRADV